VTERSEFIMKQQQELFEVTLLKYADDLPWGIYLYRLNGESLAHFGNKSLSDKYEDTEKYLADIIKDICRQASVTREVYTETSQSGIVYIAFPLILENQVWGVLSTYLSLGREGTWRRSLNRGPSVAEVVDLLDEIGFILNTHYQMRMWYSPKYRPPVEPQKLDESFQLNSDISAFAYKCC
jgi:hypothetical protein